MVRRRRQALTLLLAVLCGTLAPALTVGATAAGAERIVAFDSEITINNNASLTVTETIRVTVTGERIKHGIHRDFPLAYTAADGHRWRQELQVNLVTLDGAPEQYTDTTAGRYRRLTIGDPRRLLSPGDHTYAINYHTGCQLDNLPGQAMLRWNVCGAAWDFSIDQVTAVVRLPGDVTEAVLVLDGYTGPVGATGKAFSAKQEQPDLVRFTTTTPLAPRENLMIMVKFPASLVTPAATWHRISYRGSLLTWRNFYYLVIVVFTILTLAETYRRRRPGLHRQRERLFSGDRYYGDNRDFYDDYYNEEYIDDRDDTDTSPFGDSDSSSGGGGGIVGGGGGGGGW